MSAVDVDVTEMLD